MQTRTVVILGLAGVALTLVYRRKDQLTSEDPRFREGYVAGFFTPGPFTILALTGLAYHYG